MKTKAAQFSVEAIDPKFNDWGMTDPDTISIDVAVEYDDDLDDGQISLCSVTLKAEGFDSSQLRGLVSESAIIEGIIEFEARQRSTESRTVPGILEMLAVTSLHGAIKDDAAFDAAAKLAFGALGSVQKVFLAVTAAQASDLRLDDQYFNRIKEAV